MYEYTLINEVEKDDKLAQFQEERIQAFDKIEDRLENLVKSLRQAKIETIKYYRENPDSFGVVIGTDLIADYFKDIFTLLEKPDRK